MNVSERANVVAVWFTIGAAIVGGCLWVGAQGNEIKNTRDVAVVQSQRIDPIDRDVAALKEAVGTIKQDMADIKQSQKEILEELRKK